MRVYHTQEAFEKEEVKPSLQGKSLAQVMFSDRVVQICIILWVIFLGLAVFITL